MSNEVNSLKNKAPLIYLTYGDVDSPVYKTQVIGFCDFLEKQMDLPVQVIAFVSLRLYFAQKKLLKAYNKDIKVYPVINRFQRNPMYSAFNAFLVNRSNGTSIMTRNPAALHVCLEFQTDKKNFFYDARGCQYKELEEFSAAGKEEMKEMMELEKKCFKKADWVYSVSASLIQYFKDNHSYKDHNHSVIPCCTVPSPLAKRWSKQELFGREDVTVFCYAGALSVWNYPTSFQDLCRSILKHENNRLIILSHELDRLKGDRLYEHEHVIKRSVKSEEVAAYLEITDHAILLRKSAVTNQVASPSKFGEYVMAGCHVIISPGIGDFSEMVELKNIGVQYRGKKDNDLIKVLGSIEETERNRIKRWAGEIFIRNSELNMVKYRNLKNIHDGLVN